MIIDSVVLTFSGSCFMHQCLSAFDIDTEHGLLCSAWNGKKAWVSFQHIPSLLPRGLCSSFHGLNKTLEGLHWFVYGGALNIVYDQFQLWTRICNKDVTTPVKQNIYFLSAHTGSTIPDILAGHSVFMIASVFVCLFLHLSVRGAKSISI